MSDGWNGPLCWHDTVIQITHMHNHASICSIVYWVCFFANAYHVTDLLYCASLIAHLSSATSATDYHVSQLSTWSMLCVCLLGRSGCTFVNAHGYWIKMAYLSAHASGEVQYSCAIP